MPEGKARIYHEEDGDLSVIQSRRVAVIGYGNQGKAQAQNLRDSGIVPVIGTRRDETFRQAEADGFRVVDTAEAAREADVLLLLIPDEILPEVFKGDILPGLSPGSAISFASGYCIGFKTVIPPETVDVVLIAPRMIGVGVRETFTNGKGFPSFIGVEQNASGQAMEIALAIAKGIGSLRCGALELSFKQEAEIDLFTEQAFGPAFGQALMSAIEVEQEAGYPIEAILLELYMSGELALAMEKAARVGIIRQMDYHSQTSQYGSSTRSAQFYDPALKEKMKAVLEEIQSGRFAEEWEAERAKGYPLFQQIREARKLHPLNEWEEAVRRAFRFGEEDAT